MSDLDQGELRVVVPVGFLLSEEQEVTVSVNRPDGLPLPIRLRLVPARAVETAQPCAVVDAKSAVSPRHVRVLSKAVKSDDGFPSPEYGGSD
jgi:hypothetical protein